MILAKLRNDEMPPRGKIFYHEDTDEGMVSDSLLLFRVQNQIDGVMVVNWLPGRNSIATAGGKRTEFERAVVIQYARAAAQATGAPVCRDAFPRRGSVATH